MSLLQRNTNTDICLNMKKSRYLNQYAMEDYMSWRSTDLIVIMIIIINRLRCNAMCNLTNTYLFMYNCIMLGLINFPDLFHMPGHSFLHHLLGLYNINLQRNLRILLVIFFHQGNLPSNSHVYIAIKLGQISHHVNTSYLGLKNWDEYLLLILDTHISICHSIESILGSLNVNIQK